MAGHHYYCPYCGTIQRKVNTICIKCQTPNNLSESLYDSEYYRNKSLEKYGDYKHWYDFILEEIKANPLFNEELFNSEPTRTKPTTILNKQETNNIPKCPTCNSTNIVKIGNLKRATYGYAFGLFSKTARSQFECKNCGYKW